MTASEALVSQVIDYLVEGCPIALLQAAWRNQRIHDCGGMGEEIRQMVDRMSREELADRLIPYVTLQVGQSEKLWLSPCRTHSITIAMVENWLSAVSLQEMDC